METKGIKITLSQDMYERLCRCAELYGFPVATTCNWAIAQWVVTQERAQRANTDIADTAVKAMLPFFQQMVDQQMIESERGEDDKATK